MKDYLKVLNMEAFLVQMIEKFEQKGYHEAAEHCRKDKNFLTVKRKQMKKQMMLEHQLPELNAWTSV